MARRCGGGAQEGGGAPTQQQEEFPRCWSSKGGFELQFFIFFEREGERERYLEGIDQFPSRLPKPALKEGFIFKFHVMKV